MHAVQVTSWADGPKYTQVPDIPAPTKGQKHLKVLAAGLHQVVRSRALGKHYSARSLPHTMGVDCVAKDESTGQLYYVTSLADGFGTFVDYINVSNGKHMCIPLPESVEPASFAAGVNPATSSWMAITQRTRDLPEKWTALIIGATTASGKLAVHACKALGAGKVVGAARKADPLSEVAGLDASVTFSENLAETDFSAVEADVILDYVYGDATRGILTNLKTSKPVQYVQIGTVSGQSDMSLPGFLLRSTDLTVRGAGVGSWPISALAVQLKELAPALAKWPPVECTEVPMRDIERVWNDKSAKGRIVVVP